ncbi:MAG: alpha-hydroxy-acid oxidizing protein [Burkholderiales bacterium]|nr:alpha-hydroxy-acid oxidizing protein [Burkholderiales bacterium]
MSLSRIANLDDMRDAARRRLPKLAFDFFDGGADRESALARNRAAFDALTLTPRVLRNVSSRSIACELFGRSWAAPLGIAPTGLANLARGGADVMLARAAAALDLPCVSSTASTTSIEAVGRAAPRHTWFQLYMPKDRAIGDDLMARARAAGAEVLVMTVDLAVPGRRDRDVRNRFSLPFRLDPAMLADFMLHPGWALDMLFGGSPRLANWEKYTAGRLSAESLAALQAQQIDASLSWADVERVRGTWSGPLLLKGVLHPDDARQARALGVDGLLVSNHGGRQLDCAPATFDALPAIRDAVGDQFALLLDGGIRHGEDIAKALRRGADFCLVGRPTLYGVAAYGQAGVEHVLRLLIDGRSRTLGLLGETSVAGLRRAAPRGLVV